MEKLYFYSFHTKSTQLGGPGVEGEWSLISIANTGAHVSSAYPHSLPGSLDRHIPMTKISFFPLDILEIKFTVR